VTRVTGTERLAWTQIDVASNLRFRAYVDGAPVDLESVSCGESVDADCQAPLPSLNDGVHTIAVTAVAPSGAESAASGTITVQKVSGAGLSIASIPAATADTQVQSEAFVIGPNGLRFAVDAVAQRLKAPLQLAATPDGRLLVGDGEGRVTMLHPGAPSRDGLALDARELVGRGSVGAVGLAVHPNFAETGFVYASITSSGRGSAGLRIVRLREVGGVLGEPATVFEAPLVTASGTATAGGVSESPPPSASGARLAFGPDGLLYALLPPGVVFDHEPAASTPLASIVRIDGDGRASRAGAVDGVVTQPLGLTWHPRTNELLAILSGAGGTAAISSLGRGNVAGVSATAALSQDWGDDRPSSRRLRFDSTDTSGLSLGRLFVEEVSQLRSATIRLVVPVALDGILAPPSGDLVDLVAAGGIIYAAVAANSEPGATDQRTGLVLRLRPL